MNEKIVTPRQQQPKKVSSARKAAVTNAPVGTAVNKTVKAGVDVKQARKADKSSGKIKVIRDSFTMPQNDHAKIAELKQLCLKTGMKVKKSELLRAGLHALVKLSAAQLKVALSGLEKIETGRPRKK